MAFNEADWDAESLRSIETVGTILFEGLGEEHPIVKAVMEFPIVPSTATAENEEDPYTLGHWDALGKKIVLFVDRISPKDTWALLEWIIHEAWHAVDPKIQALVASGAESIDPVFEREAEEYAYRNASQSLLEIASAFEKGRLAPLVPDLKRLAESQLKNLEIRYE